MVNNVVSVNKDIQGGVPCFSGTRVPISSFFDHLEQGGAIDEFVEDFPTVRLEQTVAVLELAKADVPKHAE